METIIKDLLREELKEIIKEAVKEVLSGSVDTRGIRYPQEVYRDVAGVFRTEEETNLIINRVLEKPYISKNVKEEFYTEKNIREALLFLEGRKTLIDAVLSSDLNKTEMTKLYHAIAKYCGVPTKRTLQEREIKSISKI